MKKKPEPVDEKDDAQAFTSLILVVAVKLRKLGHNPKTDTQHSEGKTNDVPLEQYMQPACVWIERAPDPLHRSVNAVSHNVLHPRRRGLGSTISGDVSACTGHDFDRI